MELHALDFLCEGGRGGGGEGRLALVWLFVEEGRFGVMVVFV